MRRRAFGRSAGRSRRPVDAEVANDPSAARVAALRLLARREYAAAELASRLAERGFDPGHITALLAELREERLLDDSRYARQFVRSRAERGQGPRRIRLELKEVGIDETTLELAFDEAPDFHAIAIRLRTRRFGEELPADWAERARQSRFLQYRGFSNDHIRSALGSSGAESFAIDAEGFDDDPP